MSSDKRQWDAFVTENYDYLVTVARRYTPDAEDLVNHCYLRIIDKRFMEKPMGYFCTAMWMEATRGQFKNLYLLQDTAPPPEPIYDPDLTLSIRREQVEMIIDRLGWFDKTVIKLYLEGFNISDVARESGIKPATLYQSLHRTKKIIANAIRQQPTKER